MLKNTNSIYGRRLSATDGIIGHVKDFYFNDQDWIIRYLIVDTGSWLPGRQVLLAPNAFDGFGPDGDDLIVRLTKEQIENSPSIETHRPVTRQHEKDYYHYYSWPSYWEATGLWGVGGLPSLVPPESVGNLLEDEADPLDDIHLRGTRAVTGYEVHATDGVLGKVTGFLVDHLSWSIAKLVVEAGHWYAGHEILIPPTAVSRVDYETSSVAVRLTRSEIGRIEAGKDAKAEMLHH